MIPLKLTQNQKQEATIATIHNRSHFVKNYSNNVLIIQISMRKPYNCSKCVKGQRLSQLQISESHFEMQFIFQFFFSLQFIDNHLQRVFDLSKTIICDESH